MRPAQKHEPKPSAAGKPVIYKKAGAAATVAHGDDEWESF